MSQNAWKHERQAEIGAIANCAPVWCTIYDRFVEGIKTRIRTAQIKSALAANAELILHYWEIGREILAA